MMKKSQFRKNALAAVIAASVPFYASVSESATQTVTGGDVSVGSRVFNTSAAEGDAYLIVVETGRTGTLTVIGTLYHQENGNGNEKAVIQIQGGSTYTIDQSFGVFPNGIYATDNHGIEFSGGSGAANIGNSVVSIVKVTGGNAIEIAQEVNGELKVIGTLEGDVAINAASGGLTSGSKIILDDATLKGTTSAIDFSSATTATGLQLDILGTSTITGDVIGDDVATDNITIDGSAYLKNNVSAVETITVNGSADFSGTITGATTINVNSQRGITETTSDITVFRDNVTATDINVNGYASFAKTTNQTVTGNLSVNDGGTLNVVVDENVGTIGTPGLHVSGTFKVTNNASKIIVTPAFNAYDETGNDATISKAYIITSGTLNITAVDLTAVAAPSLLFKSANLVQEGVTNNLVVNNLEYNTPEEIAALVAGEEGAGASSEAAIVNVMKTITALGRGNAGAKNVYSKIASITDKEKLIKFATESKVNNANATQEANVLASTKVVQGITHRLNNLRDDDFNNSTGYSYGDGASNQGVWVQFLNSSSDQDKRHNDDGDEVLGFEGDMSGLTLGFESDMNGYTTGLAFTMANLDTNKKNSNDKSVIKNYQVSLYGSWEEDNYFVDGVLNLGISQHDRNRYIDGFVSTPITADFTSQHYGLQFLGGMTEEFEGIQVQPMVGFNYTMVTTESYTEEDKNDTGFAMKVDNQKYQKMELGAGVELSKEFRVNKGELEPSVRFMAWHDFKGQQVETNTRYVIGGSEFTSKGADAVKTSMQFSANLAYRRNDNMTFTAGYERNQKSDYKSDSLYLRMKYDF